MSNMHAVHIVKRTKDTSSVTIAMRSLFKPQLHPSTNKTLWLLDRYLLIYFNHLQLSAVL